MKFIRWVIAIALGIALCVGVAGCGKANEEEQPTLWIVTEGNDAMGMYQQITQVIGAFQEDHPDFEVELEVLPTEEGERDLRLRKLRSLLLAGDGPDILLLPSCNSRILIHSTGYFDEEETISARSLEQLLPDPTQSMRSGLFFDISEYYNNDEALNTEALQQTIMDAGTLGDARYILPLRYDFPAVYIQDAGVEALGLDPEEMGNGILPLLEAVLEAGDLLLAAGVIPSFCRTGSILSLLSNPLDYEGNRLTLEAEELAEFLKLYQGTEALAEANWDGRVTPNMHEYIQPENYEDYLTKWGTLGSRQIPGDAYPQTIPAAVATMSRAYQAAAITKAEGGEGYRMAPLLAADGKLTAWVTYYGAITGGCSYPEEAYDLLRRFLLEENQWEQNRPLNEFPIEGWTYRGGLVEDGWPVRYKGFLADIWLKLRRSAYRGGVSTEGKTRARRIQTIKLTDEDIPLLDAQIDRVYFGNVAEQEIAEAIRGLNDEETGEAIPTDLDALAEELTNALKYQLLEG